MPDEDNNFNGSLVLDFRNDDVTCKPRIRQPQLDYNVVTYLLPDSGVSNMVKTMKSECYRKSSNTANINHEARCLFALVCKGYDVNGCNKSVTQETLQGDPLS